jgi:hypothetical protein
MLLMRVILSSPGLMLVRGVATELAAAVFLCTGVFSGTAARRQCHAAWRQAGEQKRAGGPRCGLRNRPSTAVTAAGALEALWPGPVRSVTQCCSHQACPLRWRYLRTAASRERLSSRTIPAQAWP